MCKYKITQTFIRGGYTVTIKDIARLAGVSPATVSRVLNDPTNSFARPETRNRVWRIVEEYNFIPNSAAQILKSGSCCRAEYTLACFISHTRNEQENPFFSRLTRSLEQATLQYGFSIPFYFTNFIAGDPKQTEYIQSLKLDGAICIGRFQDEKTMMLLKKRFRNLIYIGLAQADISIDQVICDGYSAAECAMEYLTQCGHRQIAYVGAGHNELRFLAYKAVMRAHQLPTSPAMISFCEYDGRSGYQAAERLIHRDSVCPTAIFCANDSTAIAVLHGLHNQGLRVPEDISVISVDDIDAASMLTPALTTVHVPKTEMGQVAIEVLDSRIRHHRKIPIKVELPYHLVLRETVKCL